MTGRVIDRETAGFLVLLIPLAIATVILLTAWPYILGLIGLLIAGKLWQNYQWLKRCEKINPFFIQLVKENKGCITPMDLSIKADLTGRTAQRFLDRKAEEYAAQRKQLEDKGIVYYFLTASSLGSIFDDSEPLLEEEITPLTSPGLIITSSATQPHSSELSVSQVAEAPVKLDEKLSESTVEEESPQVEEPQPSETSPSQEIEAQTDTALKEESPQVEEPQPSETSSSQETEAQTDTALSQEPQTPPQDSTLNSQTHSDTDNLELIQADLAKRLEINPSTVGRRKTDPDFPEWSQSKDPEGIAWKYKRKTKTFVPVKEEQT
ncbi:conserved hypothetical protein [Gloeothece citriformis PCC 7424]|uniref:Uncharacterized protein n=1 Tax=Gloeothece citriformis (strain PCC 7424) TaxID=65393 RepID=B7K9M9_GLOC7|nr:hypothetical protein [Gloeothece citriformis]ACK69997.1 conserved hypothetical protein [Gloeothece citriformis PCC 7424]